MSIIVPVYNAKKYLPRCIDSILAQSFTAFELLLIDDGSTDGGGSICDEYRKKDARVQVYHQKNHGISAARNEGMLVSSGKWLMFCDADDEVTQDWVETLLHYAKIYPDCLINCEFADISIKGEMKKRHIDGFESVTELPAWSYYHIWKAGFSAYVWMRIFNKDVLQSNGITFDESFLMPGEDVIFIADYLKAIDERMVYVPKCCYYWIDNDGNSVSRRYNPNYYDCLCRLYWVRKELMNSKQIKDFAHNEFFRMLHHGLVDALRRNDYQYAYYILNDSAFCDARKESDYQHVSWKERLILLSKNMRLIKKQYLGKSAL